MTSNITEIQTAAGYKDLILSSKFFQAPSAIISGIGSGVNGLGKNDVKPMSRLFLPELKAKS
jgi:hypothetical protein